jgi:hypothetical protein
MNVDPSASLAGALEAAYRAYVERLDEAWLPEELVEPVDRAARAYLEACVESEPSAVQKLRTARAVSSCTSAATQAARGRSGGEAVAVAYGRLLESAQDCLPSIDEITRLVGTASEYASALRDLTSSPARQKRADEAYEEFAGAAKAAWSSVNPDTVTPAELAAAAQVVAAAGATHARVRAAW